VTTNMQYISVLKDGKLRLARVYLKAHHQISIYPTNIDIYDYLIPELANLNYICPTPLPKEHRVY
jgi:hypothetical protein